MTNIEAITKGKQKYKENSTVIGNPYTPGSSEYNDYERGWVQSLKRSGNHSTDSYSAHKATNKNSVKKAKPDHLASERYRNRK